MLHFLRPLLFQRPVRRETDHGSPPHKICSVFNAKWDQSLQLQTACGYMNMSTVHVSTEHLEMNVVMCIPSNCQNYLTHNCPLKMQFAL